MTHFGSLTRRQVLGGAAGALASSALRPSFLSAMLKDEEPSPPAQRPFGDTGETVSMLGMGGHHIGRIKDDKQAIALIRKAIDMGVTFLDNAWEYHRGHSEELMGEALRQGYRKKVFLMTKHHGRKSVDKAMKHLEDSLRRLKTDVIDLWQFHEVVYEDDPKMIFAEEGAIEAARKAKKQGKVRYIGFTGHKNPKLLLKMLEHDFPWDAAQFPVNPIDPHYKSFIREVLPVCVERKIAVLAMKTMGAGHVLKSKRVTPQQCLRFAWSHPVATVISGIDNEKHLQQNVEFARSFEPMSKAEKKRLLARTEDIAEGGKYEPFKVGLNYNGRQGRLLHNKPLR